MVNNSQTNTKVTNIPLDYLGMNLHVIIDKFFSN